MLSRYIPSDKECAVARADLEEIARLRANPPWKDPAILKNRLSRLDSGEARSKRVLKMREDGLKEPKLPMEFHALRIGDIGFVSEQFELYFEYGQRIAARSPFVQTFVIQLSAGGGGYLATERAEKNGGYGTGPLIGPVAPAGGQELVEAAVAELKQLKAMDAKADNNKK